MKVKNTKSISFGMVFAGLIFFSNPTVALHDFLPDVIGALLVYAGLRKAADADDYFYDARKLAKYLVFLYLGKLVFSFMLFSDSRNSLPFTFISGVLEIIFVLWFFSKLYNGFEYTATRLGDGKTAVLKTDVYTCSVIFTVSKAVIVFLPELLELARQTDGPDLSANANYKMSIAQLKPFAILFSVFVQLILGIIFVMYTARFFRAVKKDAKYREKLHEKYKTEHELNKTVYTNKALKAGFFMLIASAVFTVDFSVEGVDVLPDVFAALFAAAAFLYISQVKTLCKKCVAAVAAFSAASVLSTAFSLYVSPEIFELFSGEKAAFAPQSKVFLDSFAALPVTLAVCVLCAASAVYMYACFVKHNKQVYKAELLGNHDRKLLPVFVLGIASAVSKYIVVLFNTVKAKIAYIPEVSEYIKVKYRMNAEGIRNAAYENADIALFERIDGILFALELVTAALVVLLIFNIFALRTDVVKEE